MRAERALTAACAIAAVALAGCGKANLTTASKRAPFTARHGGNPPGSGERVAVPLPLTASRADAFAQAVSLTIGDVPGSHPAARSSAPRGEEQEAEACGGRPAKVLGGGRSPELQRGAGLNRESISSGVEVLASAEAVRRDLAYTSSHAGIACYAKVLGHSLRREAADGLRVLGVRVAELGIAHGREQVASGIRVEARVGLTRSPASVRLFIDALSTAYGPAELDLYTTSFVQPVAARTQHELLELLHERARRQRL